MNNRIGVLLATSVLAVLPAAAGLASGQTVTCFGETATIVAGPSGTTLGTDGDDVIVGTPGSDEIRGGGGDDRICGLGGADELYGNAGEDRINGGGGADRIRGGKNGDIIVGSRGRDRLWGNSGPDRISGSRGNDVIRGGKGGDTLRGRTGDDLIRGNSGGDICTGGPGSDQLFSCNDAATNPPGGGSFTFTAAGDHGSTPATTASLGLIRAIDPRFHLALGDLSYGGDDSEQAWCRYMDTHLPDTPVEVVVGNHESDSRLDGHITNFATCMPDGMNASGDYGTEYYFDVGGLLRVIMIGAGNRVGGERIDYFEGNAHYRWLSNAIDDARSDGIPWVAVGMHKVCITAGIKVCEVGQDVSDLLLDKKVDLILHGHEHNYQRSKQLTCASVDQYVASCVADSGADGRYTKGAGSVWAVVGTMGGSSLYDIDAADPEYRYLAASMGANDAQSGRGFLEVDVSETRLSARFVGSTTEYVDEFVIEADS